MGESDRSERWKRLFDRFWFLRGVAAAISVAEIVPRFTSLEDYEFLRAFHALLVGWNQVAAWTGDLIGSLPFLPHVPYEVINGLLFTSSVAISIGYWVGWRWPWLLGPSEPLSNRLIAVLCCALFGFFSYMFLMYGGGLRWRLGSPEFYFFALPLGFLWLFTLVNMEGYRRGIVYVFGFVLGMQALYSMKTPWVRDEINALTTSALGSQEGEATERRDK